MPSNSPNQFLYKVGRTFKASNRGYILTPDFDYSIKDFDPDIKIMIGRMVILVMPDGSSLEAKITGLNFRFALDLLIDIPNDVPVGTEVWLIQNQ